MGIRFAPLDNSTVRISLERPPASNKRSSNRPALSEKSSNPLRWNGPRPRGTGPLVAVLESDGTRFAALFHAR